MKTFFRFGRWGGAMVIGAAGLIVAIGASFNMLAQRAASQERVLHARIFSDIVGGLRAYDHNCDGLPNVVCRDPFGKPCCSWRCRVLPFLEQVSLPWTRFVPWYHPANHVWAGESFASSQFWFCFSRKKEKQSKQSATVWAVTGRGTAFDEKRPHRLDDIPSNTILLIEAGESGTQWLEPGDLDIAEVRQSITGGTDGTGVVVAFADGEAWFLDRAVPLEELKKFFTIEEASRSDREKVLGPYRKARFNESERE